MLIMFLPPFLGSETERALIVLESIGGNLIASVISFPLAISLYILFPLAIGVLGVYILTKVFDGKGEFFFTSPRFRTERIMAFICYVFVETMSLYDILHGLTPPPTSLIDFLAGLIGLIGYGIVGFPLFYIMLYAIYYFYIGRKMYYYDKDFKG